MENYNTGEVSKRKLIHDSLWQKGIPGYKMGFAASVETAKPILGAITKWVPGYSCQ